MYVCVYAPILMCMRYTLITGIFYIFHICLLTQTY